jgi:hypothetical protein
MDPLEQPRQGPLRAPLPFHDATSGAHIRHTQTHLELFQNGEPIANRMAGLQAAAVALWDEPEETRDEWDSQADTCSVRDPDPLRNNTSQAMIAKVSMDVRLSTLKGKTNYETWAAEIKDVLKRVGIAYILDYSGSLYGSSDSPERRYHSQVACDLIYQYMGAERAKNLKALTRGSKVAKYVWKELRNDVYYGCICTMESLGDLVESQESFRGSCTFCQLVLEAVESATPGWTRSSAIPTTILTAISTKIRKSSPEKYRERPRSVTLGASSLQVVTIGHSNTWKQLVEFFLQPGKDACSPSTITESHT